jgi:hypothetical protein
LVLAHLVEPSEPRACRWRPLEPPLLVLVLMLALVLVLQLVIVAPRVLLE